MLVLVAPAPAEVTAPLFTVVVVNDVLEGFSKPSLVRDFVRTHCVDADVMVTVVGCMPNSAEQKLADAE